MACNVEAVETNYPVPSAVARPAGGVATLFYSQSRARFRFDFYLIFLPSSFLPYPTSAIPFLFSDDCRRGRYRRHGGNTKRSLRLSRKNHSEIERGQTLGVVGGGSQSEQKLPPSVRPSSTERNTDTVSGSKTPTPTPTLPSVVVSFCRRRRSGACAQA